MAWRHHRIWIIAILLISGIALAWLIAQTPPPGAPVTEPVATTTPDLVGQSIYTNGEHGFAIVYPGSATVENNFVAGGNLTDSWRVHAIGTGTPVVALTTYSHESGHSYPRSFRALVRIGASTDPKEVAGCERLTPDRGETALPDSTFGDATWKAFSFGDAGMQKYVRGISYRTERDGTCYAIEQIAAGSSYREDPVGPDTIADEVLEAEFAKLDEIVKSFSFAR